MTVPIEQEEGSLADQIDKARQENQELRRRVVELNYPLRRTEMVHSVFRYKLIYALGGLLLDSGALSMVAGSILFLFGVIGSTSWTANILGAESSISDAAPGSVLFVVGLFVIVVSRFRMNIRTGTGSRYVT